MAEVFIGSALGAEGFERRVAIKRVLPGYSDNPAFAQMFVSEAQISSRLTHPNIVSVLDFDRDADNRLFLVMELVEGKDLDGLASTGPLPVPVIIFVITEVLRGLGHAHDLPLSTGMRGIVHRDISPHNVLLSWDGGVKVSDFGIAKARNASEATASVFIKGKPAYMSPEQANGQPLDGRSDLFAVGVMLWEMLVGRRLFVGEDTRATLASVLFGQIPRPRQMRGDVPKDLERVTMKLLERDLPARYPNAEAAIDDLLACDQAPKNGREALRRVLAERFPQEAPVRGSSLSHPHTPVPYQAHAMGSTPGTAPVSGMPSASSPMASIGAQRSAPTASIRPRRSGAGAKIALGIGGMLVAAVVTFAIIAVAKRGKQESRPAAGSGSAAPQVAVTPPSPAPDAAIAMAIDAGPPPPADAASPPIDAAEPAKKDAPVAVPSHAGAEKKGHLSVVAFPVMTVYIDKKRIHDTPVEIDLPAGKHQVRLVNAEQGKDEMVPIVIEADRTKTIDRTH